MYNSSAVTAAQSSSPLPQQATVASGSAMSRVPWLFTVCLVVRTFYGATDVRKRPATSTPPVLSYTKRMSRGTLPAVVPSNDDTSNHAHASAQREHPGRQSAIASTAPLKDPPALKRSPSAVGIRSTVSLNRIVEERVRPGGGGSMHNLASSSALAGSRFRCEAGSKSSSNIISLASLAQPPPKQALRRQRSEPSLLRDEPELLRSKTSSAGEFDLGGDGRMRVHESPLPQRLNTTRPFVMPEQQPVRQSQAVSPNEGHTDGLSSVLDFYASNSTPRPSTAAQADKDQYDRLVAQMHDVVQQSFMEEQQQHPLSKSGSRPALAAPVSPPQHRRTPGHPAFI
ncbi:hypothetical protein RI367_002157 [Sorochytrium milnesiophthora]